MNSSFSIVIASIGSDSLAETITAIGLSSILPSEIIVVVPKNNRFKFIEFKSDVVQYVYVDFMGQVNQRIHGFGLAKSEYVIQLDDDIIVERTCFENLLKCFKVLSGKRIVGPSFFYKDGLSCYAKISLFNRLLSCLLFIRIKPGIVSPLGYGYGSKFSDSSTNYFQSNWLAGGCVLLHSSDLPMQSHFPYSGKAYCEDLIFSTLKKKENYQLYVVKNAICFIDKPFLNKDNYDLKSDYQARRYLLSISNISAFKLEIWYFIKRIFKFSKF